MGRSKSTLEQLWQREDNSRQTSLEMARLCAALTCPHVLPSAGATPDTIFQENYQSQGAYGINNLANQLVNGLWPLMLPWFKFAPSYAKLVKLRRIPQLMNAVNEELFHRESWLQSLFDAAGVHEDTRGGRAGFRTHKRTVMEQLLVTGDTLELIDDNFQFQNYRRDMYTVRRDSSGNVMYILTKEKIDPATLTRRQLEDAKIKESDVEGAHDGSASREKNLITRIEYHYRSKVWVIEQSVDGHLIRLGAPGKEKEYASEERVNKYFVTAYKLVGGEHYGRGFVETECKADLRSLDTLMRRILEWAALVTKAVPCIAEDSILQAQDLDLPHGVPIRCRVEGGKPTDFGFATVDKIQDLGYAKEVMNELSARVARVTLTASGSVRNSERTTKYEVQNTSIRELNQALSGSYPAISDQQQLPNIRRIIHMLESNPASGWTKWEKGAVDIHILTGSAALVKAAKADDLLGAAQVCKELEAGEKINKGGFVDAYLRYKGIDEPTIFLSDEQVAKNQQKQLALQAQQQANEQAISTAGKIVEGAAQQGQRPPQPGRAA